MTNVDTRMLISGKLRAAPDVFVSFNPFTAKPLGFAPQGSVEDMRSAIAAARQAFDQTTWRTDHAFRARCLRQIRDVLAENRSELSQLIVDEVGSPISLTPGQLDGPVNDITAMADLAENFEYETRVSGGSTTSNALVSREPWGVAGLITPYNFPIQQLLVKAVPALAAGNTVVVKPSPLTPLITLRVAELIAQQTELPDGVLNVVTGEGVELGEALTSDSRIDIVSFTGSTDVGRRVLAAAAPNIIRVLLELGGKSPSILLDDVDVSAVVKREVRALCAHAGQGCTSRSRLLVPRGHYEEACEVATEAVADLPMGDPNDPSMIAGPLISSDHQAAVEGFIERAGAEGARVLRSANSPFASSDGYFVQPTAVADVSSTSQIATEEIFGPVTVLLAYEHVEEAIDIANSTAYGLAASVWSSSTDRALAVAKQLRAGVLDINGSARGSTLPFGGVKRSGLGREKGEVGFAEYLDYRVTGLGPPGVTNAEVA